MGKTGTTAIQSFLNEERKKFMKIGVLVSGVFLENLRRGYRLPLQSSVLDPKLLCDGLKEIERAASRMDGIDHVVWSNETLNVPFNLNMVSRTAGVVSAFARETNVFDKVEIVLVFRRQDEWIESAYRQWGLKHKFYGGRRILSPEEFFNKVKPFLNYSLHYQKWSQATIGPVRVISYDEVESRGSIVRPFCDLLGLNWDDSFSHYNHVYSSPGPALSYFYANYNRGFGEAVDPEHFARMIEGYNLPELSSPDTAFFSAKLRRDILAQYDESNRKLARCALGSDQLFSERPVKEVEPYITGSEDTLTYLSMITRQQHELLSQRGAFRTKSGRRRLVRGFLDSLKRPKS